jgi:hypothetical protein
MLPAVPGALGKSPEYKPVPKASFNLFTGNYI